MTKVGQVELLGNGAKMKEKLENTDRRLGTVASLCWSLGYFFFSSGKQIFSLANAICTQAHSLIPEAHHFLKEFSPAVPWSSFKAQHQGRRAGYLQGCIPDVLLNVNYHT